MAREKVDITAHADVANAIAQMMELVKTYGKLGDGAESVGQRGAKASTEWAGGIDLVLGKWFGISKAIDAATIALTNHFAMQRKLEGEKVDATREIDRGVTGWLAATGLRRGSAEANQGIGLIGSLETTTASQPGAGFDAARLLASRGVGINDPNWSGAMRATLETSDIASQLAGVDQSAYSGAVLTGLSRHGHGLTGKNISTAGAAAYSLLQSRSGFNLGMVEEYNSVATSFASAGYDYPTGLSMWAALRSKEERRYATAQARSLLDQNVQPGERERLAALHAQGAALRAAGGDYETAQFNVQTSMATREQGAATGGAYADYRPGKVGGDEARNRLKYLTHQLGLTDVQQTRVLGAYDNPSVLAGMLGLGDMYGTSDKASAAAGALNQILPSTDIRGRLRRYESLQGQITGQQPINIRLLVPDGRDLPIQVEAEALNVDFSNDASQSTNFRP